MIINRFGQWRQKVVVDDIASVSVSLCLFIVCYLLSCPMCDHVMFRVARWYYLIDEFICYFKMRIIVTSSTINVLNRKWWISRYSAQLLLMQGWTSTFMCMRALHSNLTMIMLHDLPLRSLWTGTTSSSTLF